MYQVNASFWNCGRSRVPFNNGDISQRSIGNEASRFGNRPLVAFDTDHLAGRTDALREKVEHSLWATTEINRSAAFFDANSVEHPGRFLPKLLSLSFEPSFFIVTVAEQVQLRVWC